MNRNLLGALLVLLVVVNLLLVCLFAVPGNSDDPARDPQLYYFISQMDAMEPEAAQKHMNLALWYNLMLTSKIDQQDLEEAYEGILGFSDGMMAYLEIPSLQMKTPIRHGVDNCVVESGFGHMPGTSFPIGGKGTHSMLIGTQKLNALQPGDRIYIHILNEILCYRVESVGKYGLEDISGISHDPEGDQCTLISYDPSNGGSEKWVVHAVRADLDAKTVKAENSEAQTTSGTREFGSALMAAACMLLLPTVTGLIGRGFVWIRSNRYCGSYTKKRKIIACYEQKTIDTSNQECYTQPIIQ